MCPFKTLTASFISRPDELCLVKLYNEYYRAVLIDSKYKGRDRYEFVDYGYILPVKTENVRRLPDNLLFPCITLKCFLDGKFIFCTDKSKIYKITNFIFSAPTGQPKKVKNYRRRIEDPTITLATVRDAHIPTYQSEEMG